LLSLLCLFAFGWLVQSVPLAGAYTLCQEGEDRIEQCRMCWAGLLYPVFGDGLLRLESCVSDSMPLVVDAVIPLFLAPSYLNIEMLPLQVSVRLVYLLENRLVCLHSPKLNFLDHPEFEISFGVP